MSFHWSCFIVPSLLEICSFIDILVFSHCFIQSTQKKKKERKKKRKLQKRKRGKEKKKIRKENERKGEIGDRSEDQTGLNGHQI